MAFDSLNAFLFMEGHGPYVWTCYGVFFVLLGWLVFWSFQQRRRLKAQQRRLWQFEARQREAAAGDRDRQSSTPDFSAKVPR